MRIAIAATVAALAATGPAMASGPISAPSPAAPDGASFFNYISAYQQKQEPALTRADRAVDRWLDARPGSARERRAKTAHRKAMGQVRANVNALRRDTVMLNGCQAGLVTSHSSMARAHNIRQNAMGSYNLRRLVQGERIIAVEFGRTEGNVFLAGLCLAEQGWQFNQVPGAA